MNNKKHFLALMFLMAAMTAGAQDYTIREIQPGADGPLPTLPEFTPPAAGTFGGLFLTEVSYHHYTGFIVNGTWMNLDTYEASMNYNLPEDFDGDYFTVETRTATQGWTALGDDSGPYHYNAGNVPTPQIKEDTEYRMVLHGGSMDGYTSNVVKALMPTVHYSYRGRAGWSEPNYIAVGEEVGACFIEMERQDRGTYNSSTNRIDYVTYEKFGTQSTCYRHQWYRMNPLSYEMTAIPGATSSRYTPTVADVGYHLVDVTRGDDVNISFYYAHDHGPVQTMINCSFEYIGYDGFILNTNYGLPNGGKDIEAIDWNSSEGNIFPLDDIVEVKPGQYAFIAPMTEESSYMIEYSDKSYFMNMEYVFGSGEEEYTMSRWASLFYGETLPLFAQATVDTPIDVIGRDINGDMVVKATIEKENLDPDDPYIYLLPGKYYLKARAVSTNFATYYPSELLWSDATAVQPGWDIDEEWNYINRSFTINLRQAPRELTGTGIIEGTVSVAQGAGSRAAAPASVAGITIYLQQKGGNIAASTVTASILPIG